MAFYLIHTCKKREWYVRKYLIPSLKAQGIADDQMEMWLDEDGVGNLESFVRSCEYVYQRDPKGGTWHIQDDVIVCNRFKELSEEYDQGIVNGFCNAYLSGSLTFRTGEVPVINSWYSFPCIRIPNHYANKCARWYREYVIPMEHNRKKYAEGKNDDALWRDFLVNNYLGEVCTNLKPNLVDHIDYLIGGTVVNSTDVQRRAAYFENPELVVELEKNLKGNNERKKKKRRKM